MWDGRCGRSETGNERHRLSGCLDLKAWAITTVLVLVSALNFVSGSSWELLLGTFALFFALLCAVVAVLESSSARSDGLVGNDSSKREE
jgi:hypothetical protein